MGWVLFTQSARVCCPERKRYALALETQLITLPIPLAGMIYFGAGWNKTPIPAVSDLKPMFMQSWWFMTFFTAGINSQPAPVPHWFFGMKQLHWSAMMGSLIGPFPFVDLVPKLLFFWRNSICILILFAAEHWGVLGLAGPSMDSSKAASVKAAQTRGVIRTVNPPTNVFSLTDWLKNPTDQWGMAKPLTINFWISCTCDKIIPCLTCIKDDFLS